MKTFEKSIINLSHDLAFKKAKLIDNEYKLDVKELSSEEKLNFVSMFLQMNNNLDVYIQEYLNEACQDRMYSESQPFGEWNE